MSNHDLDQLLLETAAVLDGELAEFPLDGAARELLNEVMSDSNTVSTHVDRSTTEPALVHSNATDDVVIDSFKPNFEPIPTGSRFGLRAAAAVVVIALIGLGVWAISQNEDSTVFSDESGGEQSVVDELPTGFIDGPEEPFIVIATADVNQAMLEECLRSTSQTEGSAAVGYADGSEETELSRGMVLINDAVTLRECSLSVAGRRLEGSSGSSPTNAWVPPSEEFPVLQRWGGKDRIEGSAEFTFDIFGSAIDTVVDLQLVGVEDQHLQRIGTWFRIDGTTNDPENDFVIQVTFEDGTTELVGPIEIPNVRCQDADCVASEFGGLRSEALSAGATQQAAPLADGVLSQAEYNVAQERFLSCIDSNTDLAGPFPAFVAAGTSAADEVQLCYDDEISVIESARSIQNGLTGYLLEEGLAETSLETANESALPTLPGNMSTTQWREVPNPFEGLHDGTTTFVSDVVTSDGVAWAVGEESVEIGDSIENRGSVSQAIVWRSGDGETWEAIDLGFGPLSTPVARQVDLSSFHSVLATEDGFIWVFGNRFTLNRDTDEASIDPVAFRSVDGQTWQPMDIPITSDGPHVSVADAASEGNRVAIVVEDYDLNNEGLPHISQTWTTTDGQEWIQVGESGVEPLPSSKIALRNGEVVSVTDRDLPRESSTVTALEVGPGFLVAIDEHDRITLDGRLVDNKVRLWQSIDGLSWAELDRVLPDRESERLQGVLAHEGGVLVAVSWDDIQETRIALLNVDESGAVTELTALPMPSARRMFSLNSGLFVVGSSNGEQEQGPDSIWVAQ